MVPLLLSTVSPLRTNTATLRHGEQNWIGCYMATISQGVRIKDACSRFSFPKKTKNGAVVHIAIVCGFNRKFYKQCNSQQPVCDMQSRLLPTNQIVNCDGRVRPDGRTLFLFCRYKYPCFSLCRLMPSRNSCAACSPSPCSIRSVK